MKAIIRNSSHGNDIIVLKVLDEQLMCKWIEKTSVTTRGVEALRSEYQGYSWYNDSLTDRVDLSKEETKFGYRLKVGYIDGVQVDYRSGMLENVEAIRSIVKHYCEVWGQYERVNTLASVHGDLSLYNVIFENADPVFIDWEHFSYNALPVGFDALYLLFVSLFFEIGKRKIPSQRMLEFISEQIAFVNKSGCLNDVYKKFPLATVIESINANRSIWNLSDEDIVGKLPILQWSDKTINHIDNSLNQTKEG